ncbi:hypothetical protein BAUCODRAFT_69367 [Baudoinia panamericana UAMH 10762]|uniref:Zn(2)-C6 fungal-type domain-containing protein n=1 Tax=Baudoinia panamericana (strain UAMH 10762) TaxID=717646 RepID=M2NBK7_BAUPA|nr:uncharacterized protein BAUCODRAFT_69367 [Baudoinia panamericana UAMH 10762]EMC96290.1 hypothetical protein BAUCODRAFT_69367 [Baudoinia panamericana UAMH 10762]
MSSTIRHTSSAGVRKKSAFSCEACRRRKVKCDGRTPECACCVVRGEACVYKQSPSLSYTKTLELRVAQLERALAQVNNAAFTTNESKNVAPVFEDVANAFEGFQIDEAGRVLVHGPTSFYHLARESSPKTSPSSLPGEEGGKERLVNSAWTARAFEKLSNLPEQTQYLLDSHWCWIQPLFNFVYRPAFTRDMKDHGKYYSDALLNAVLSHSVRWCKLVPHEQGVHFRKQAREALMARIQVGHASIPDVQTLLLLSAQECGHGNFTQAWLYSGMAFRLIEDLGIIFDGRRYAGPVQFTTEDIEVRNRLFWSCYFWDKLIALYLGRLPTIRQSKVSPPRHILDDTGEIDVWMPHGIEHSLATAYPPHQAHGTSCFTQFCGLAEILEVVLVSLYNPVQQSTPLQTANCVVEQSRRLTEWYGGLPEFLKITVSAVPKHCPPSHIVTLNCLYHTINILLHRAMITKHCGRTMTSPANEAEHLRQCVLSATATTIIFDLAVRSFGDGHVVTCQAYTIYTSASVFLLHLQATKDSDSITIQHLKYCVNVLERLKKTSPVITAPLSLIEKELQKLGVDLSSPVSGTTHDNTTSEAADLAEEPIASDASFAPDGSAGLNDFQNLDFDMDTFDITPEMLSAMSSIEPMSANVNAWSEFEDMYVFN